MRDEDVATEVTRRKIQLLRQEPEEGKGEADAQLRRRTAAVPASAAHAAHTARSSPSPQSFGAGDKSRE